MPGRKCLICGENSVIQEEDGAVCMNCGIVHSEQKFVSEGSIGYQNPDFLHSEIPSHARQLKAKREQPIVKRCKAKVRSLCAKLAFSSEMSGAADALFVRALQCPEFQRMVSYKKNLLSHCCVYITGRQFNFPITIKEFCAITRQSVSDIARLYQKIISKLVIEIQYQSIASLITYHLSDSIFNRECLEMVKDILKLYERKRTSCSPHRDVTIGLAAYLAWGSMNLMEYRTCRIKDFARQHKFIFTPMWRTRLKELVKILTEVGSHLPWISNTTSKYFVVKNLKDILQFQNSLLLKDLMENDSEEEEDEKNECDDKEDDSENTNEENECETEDDQNGHECMYMYNVSDNDETFDTDLAPNKNLNGDHNAQNKDESVCVEIEPANKKILNYSDLAGKTFVYHTTLRVISADLPTK
ncbi:transcription factor IIIB 50 kDa subunit-like [Ylistrum balloti]|uniref:transcription factor IIIB 50 kDa subunit-like n=1 Tax=Ylistrum balloti TaxID=509963 RepID=UPI002905DE63|nr:transcription factor IIIB 50 kDa subunit-like [Ylistrum balloti]